ncbi:MAG: HD domain-containing protein [Candidatus Shapirobacteria bacterium]
MYQETLKRGESIGKITFQSEKLLRAYNLASESHKGQLRKSGEPYFNHCVEVLKILHDEWGISEEKYLVAALLHDTVEDTGITSGQIKNEFGEEVSELIEGVTKLSNGNDKDTLSKVLNKSYINPGVAVIKLADRLHNMRTLGFMKAEKQIEKSTETLDVYTRLAESLGLWQVKIELEDLCFKYLDPDSYEQTKQQIDTDPRLDILFISHIKSNIDQLLTESGFNGGVDSRVNGYWCLKEKQRRLSMKGKCSPDTFDEINDVISFRVELNSIGDCYKLLEIIHKNFGEMVDYDRFDEFIGANKRVNGYEAIQTTINFPQGPVEIALLTQEMEEFNNWGVVSLIKKNEPDLRDYVLKLVFTPSGSIRFMRKEATGVDFAALINPRVLAEAIGIRVNGNEKAISTVIPNASTIEVLVGKSRRAPMEQLEDFCLPQTRKIIQEQRRLEKRDILIEKGKEIMETILSPRGLLDLSDLGDIINPILYNFGCQGCDDLHFMVGNRSINTDELNMELDKAHITKTELNLSTLRLGGIDCPGILIDVVKIIDEMGTNIVHIDQKNTDNVFLLRIIVKGLNLEQEIKLRGSLGSDDRFNSCVVV